MKSLKFLMIAATALTAASFAAPATAQEVDPDAPFAACPQKQAQNSAFVAQLTKAADREARAALIADFLKADVNNAICLLETVKNEAPELGQETFEIIIALLSLDPANDKLIELITRLFSQYAQVPGDIEPAAGPEGFGGVDFGPGGEGNPENPGQLNDGDAETPPASPSAI